MEDLRIEQTGSTPLIDFKITGQLCIEGKSIPENTPAFYKPAFDWIEQYQNYRTSKIKLDIKMEFFNTSSSKCILDILKGIEILKKQGAEVSVNWYYNDEDENLLDCGEDFAQIIHIDFNFIKTG
jgi:hypothetical protein